MHDVEDSMHLTEKKKYCETITQYFMKLRADLAYIYVKFKSLTQAAKKIDGVQALLPNNITPIKKMQSAYSANGCPHIYLR